MNHLTDAQLLRDYADRRSEPAFAELVRRHVDWVHSAAQRMVCDSHLAQDVTQGVFVALAKNAGQLTGHPVLAGWLHRTAQNIAAQTVRTEVRRRARESEAAAMNELLSAEPEAVWEQVAPLLDAALGELTEPDRDALLLRYFEKKTAREMALTLGVSDEAAQKRVSRAVERVRGFFARHGVTVGGSGLVAVISANAVQAAPAGLAVAISTAATLAGTTLATTATVTATKTIAMTTLQKTIIGAALVAAVGTGIYQAHQTSALRREVQSLQRQRDQLGELATENERLSKSLAQANGARKLSEDQFSELMRLRGEVGGLRKQNQQLVQAKPGFLADPTEATAKLLAGRVARLKQRLGQTPEAGIPELELLDEEDWLAAVKGHSLDTDTDYRRALSALRSAAEGKFASRTVAALKGFISDHGGQFPTDLNQLQPYFESPLSPAMFDRWEIAPGNNVPNVGVGKTIITQKAPVDDVFDTRQVIGKDGTGSTDFLFAGTYEVLEQVSKAYRAANNGQMHTNFSQLLPFATTPEQQTAIQKVILRTSNLK